MAILRQNLFQARQLMGWHFRFSDKTVENLQSYPGNVVSGGIRFMQIFAGLRSRANASGVVENGDFRFIRSLSSKNFTYMVTEQLSGDTTVNDLGHISSHWTVSHQISQKLCVIRHKLL